MPDSLCWRIPSGVRGIALALAYDWERTRPFGQQIHGAGQRKMLLAHLLAEVLGTFRANAPSLKRVWDRALLDVITTDGGDRQAAEFVQGLIEADSDLVVVPRRFDPCGGRAGDEMSDWPGHQEAFQLMLDGMTCPFGLALTHNALGLNNIEEILRANGLALPPEPPAGWSLPLAVVLLFGGETQAQVVCSPLNYCTDYAQARTRPVLEVD